MSNLKVPLEALSHQFRRTQKILSRDMNSINERIAASSAQNISQEDLDDISQKLQVLVELVESSDTSEKTQLASLEARIKEEYQQLSVSDLVAIHVLRHETDFPAATQQPWAMQSR